MRKLISSVGFAIKMNPSVFRLVDAKWGPHTIDRFAAYDNDPRFNSKFASPGSSGVTPWCKTGVVRTIILDLSSSQPRGQFRLLSDIMC